MKINKTIRLGASLVMVGAMLAACSDSKDDPSGPTDDGTTHVVGIKTNVILNTKASLVTDFANNDAMNIFVKSWGAIDADDVTGYTGVKAVNQGGNWTLTPEVRIAQGTNYFLYAVYPYNAANTNPRAVPVNVNEQVDVLYSGNYVPVSYTTHTVTLNMKHALTMMAFNVKKEGYSGDGLVTSVALSNETHIATKGTLNISTGAFTATEYGVVKGTVNAVAGANGISGVLPGLWVAPFSTLNTGTTIKAVFTIDGKDYTCELPEVSANRGWQYVFHLILTSNGLAVDASATEEYQLDMADDQFGQLDGYGVLKVGMSGGTFNFPTFTGDNVFGNVRAGATSVNYTPGGSVELTGAETVVVETWNSTGFSLPSLENVERIDLSAY